MRLAYQAKALAFATSLVVSTLASLPAMAANGCSTISASVSRVGAFPYTMGPFTVSLVVGDTVTLTDSATTGPSTATLTVGSNSRSFAAPGTGSITVTTSGIYQVTASATAARGGATLRCSPGSGAESQQLINNAQTAVANGIKILQNYQEWVTKGVLGSFGMTRGGGSATAPRNEEPTAEAKVDGLVRRERDLREELASLAAADHSVADLSERLGIVRRELRYARTTASLANERGPKRSEPLGDRHPADVADAPQQAVAPRLSLDSRDLLDTCSTDCAAGDALARRWNVWLEGRLVGANDWLLLSNTSGVAGAAGIDYKFLPWLAVGMSVGVESFETRFGPFRGQRMGSIGLSAVPYFGMRLADNLYASGFAGLTKIDYDTNPAVGATANFQALRYFVGGTLSGVWHAGAWRFQPSILGAYGSERQDAYTDSFGVSVPSQTISFGRISVGPEVGYTFRDEGGSWSVEPFVLVKASLDFSSAAVSSFAGTQTVVRPGTVGSGQIGLGTAVQLPGGAYLRLQASYDSIGVSGLDVWSGLVRGGVNF